MRGQNCSGHLYLNLYVKGKLDEGLGMQGFISLMGLHAVVVWRYD